LSDDLQRVIELAMRSTSKQEHRQMIDKLRRTSFCPTACRTSIMHRCKDGQYGKIIRSASERR